MKLQTIQYDSSKLTSGSPDRQNFKNSTSAANVIYFFYKDTKCLYIGETSDSLYDRCFKHTPKHSKKAWFNQANTIHIIELDAEVDAITRQALESVFILTFRPIENKKA